jgi:hypothetical protein
MRRHRVDGPNQLDARQAGQHTGVIAAHHAGTNDADAKSALRHGLHAGCGPFGTHYHRPQIDSAREHPPLS